MATENEGGIAAVAKDILPIPDNIEDPEKHEASQSLGQSATISHALANADHDEKGHAQQDHDNEVKDLGWNETNKNIPNPLVGGLQNDGLWVLIRRFNKVRITRLCMSLIYPLTLFSKCTMSKKTRALHLVIWT